MVSSVEILRQHAVQKAEVETICDKIIENAFKDGLDANVDAHTDAMKYITNYSLWTKDTVFLERLAKFIDNAKIKPDGAIDRVEKRCIYRIHEMADVKEFCRKNPILELSCYFAKSSGNVTCDPHVFMQCLCTKELCTFVGPVTLEFIQSCINHKHLGYSLIGLVLSETIKTNGVCNNLDPVEYKKLVAELPPALCKTINDSVLGSSPVFKVKHSLAATA